MPPENQSLRSIPFDDKESGTMLSLGLWMRFIGYFLIGIVIVIFFIEFVNYIALIKKGEAFGYAHFFFFLNYFLLIIFAAMGVLLIKGAKYLRLVVNTDEQDQMYLGRAMTMLKNFFKMLGLIILVYLLVMIVVFAFFAAILTMSF